MLCCFHLLHRHEVQFNHILRNVSNPKFHFHDIVMINLQKYPRSLRYISDSKKTKNPSSSSSKSGHHSLVPGSSNRPGEFRNFFLRYGITEFNVKGLILKRPSLVTEILHQDLLQQPSFQIVRLSDVGYFSPVQVLRHNLEKVIGPNISTLQNYGVSVNSILKLLTNHPATLMKKPDRFKELVDVAIKQMQLNPSSPMFIYTFTTIAEMNSSTWKNKLGIYREFGFSDEQVLSMFKKQPGCMIAAEEKIRRVLEFLLKKMKVKPAEIYTCPNVFGSSMKRRIQPRYAVMNILCSQGVLKKRYSLSWILKLTEEDFLERYVIKYQERLPQLVKAYHHRSGNNNKSSVTSVDDGWLCNRWMGEEGVSFTLSLLRSNYFFSYLSIKRDFLN